MVLLGIGAFFLSRSRTYQVFGRLLSRVETTEKVIALTLDDGPERSTPEILDMLDKLGIRATFYLIGERMAANPEWTKAIAERGHEIGNHTYTHHRMVFKSPGFIPDEIEKSDELIRQAGTTGTITFRPPYGKKLFGLPWYLAKTNRTTVTWDIEPESDGTDIKNADAIVADVMKRARPGSIILLHPMQTGSQPIREAIGKLVPALKVEGYRFVTVGELIAAGKQGW
ncbi:MAG: polysaccharide deacetylase family protein [Candidatus Sumerlaeaceae bacterium]|nr:polysaccharide deacetylase family protein [Candidatus Sumerlaeaceae bacterium]